MPDEAYRNQVLYMLIQDLAELWLEDRPNSRQLDSVHDGQFQRIALKIVDITGQNITSKTLRNYLHGKIGQKSQLLDLIASAWLVATGQADKKAVNFDEGTSATASANASPSSRHGRTPS